MTAAPMFAELTAPPSSISASLSITSVSPDQASRAARPPEAWTAGDVHAYIMEEIIRLHGAQLPYSPQGGTRAVTDQFCERFGIPAAARIARAVFEIYGGMWQGAPVTIKRFLPGHDDFFARKILSTAQET